MSVWELQDSAILAMICFSLSMVVLRQSGLSTPLSTNHSSPVQRVVLVLVTVQALVIADDGRLKLSLIMVLNISNDPNDFKYMI